MTRSNNRATLKGLLLAASALLALPLPGIIINSLHGERAVAAPLMGVAHAQDNPAASPSNPLLNGLKGTVAFIGGITCSASLVTLKGRSKSEKALMLTSGHCIGRGNAWGSRAPAAGQTFQRIKENRPFTLLTGNAARPVVYVRSEELVYATMTDLDVAIYQLAESYEEIERRTGATPFMISTAAQIPSGIRVRVPSAMHRTNQVCATGTTIPRLKEFVWNWGPVLRVTGECRFAPGASGSPVIREDTNEVIGVLGTVYRGDRNPCDIHNPCEIDEEGTASVAEKGQPYAHFVSQLYACLDDRGSIDASTVGCRLPRS